MLDITVEEHDTLLDILLKVHTEFLFATEANGPFNSAHEGYAVILEEMDELWEEVKKKASSRDAGKLEKEAIQVAAMAVRFINDIVRTDRIKI
jgi:hypothetical protein